MRVLVAPSCLKECLSAADAASAIAAGVRRAGAQAVLLPLADGGRGTLDALAPALDLARRTVRACGPLGDAVDAEFGLDAAGRTAVFEMASASGLALVPPARRNALLAGTRGTGDVLRAALEAGARRVFMGIGDSATSDGGCGMAQALGYRLLDAAGRDIGPGAAGVLALDRIDPAARHPLLAGADVRVACDVDNPLLGPRGSARVFAPQKGASAEDVERIETALTRLADVIRRDLGVDVRPLPGGGAAGGLGAGAAAFLGARLAPGAEWVLEAVDIDRRLAGVDLVITAEGRFDAQSLGGKAPVALARRAAARGVPCAVVAGSLGPGWEEAKKLGVTDFFSLVGGNVTLAHALAHAAQLLAARAEEAVRRRAADTGAP